MHLRLLGQVKDLSVRDNQREAIDLDNKNYHFIKDWRVESTINEVSEVLGDPLALMRWWPSVYLDVKVVEPGEEHGLGRVVNLYTKGWLPYTLRWDFRTTEVRKDGFTLVAWGDFDGRGIWTFEQDGPWANITYDWKIKAEKLLLRYFSFIMKPLFSANHHWAMAKGEESLKLELERRHPASQSELVHIPAPPHPTFSSPMPLLFVSLSLFSLASILFYFVMRLFSRD